MEFHEQRTGNALGMNTDPRDPKARIFERAHQLGFDAFGVARADVPLDVDHARYLAFLGAGFHGTMEYLSEHRDVRRQVDTDRMLAGAKSVICVVKRYQRARADEARDPELATLIARYARGRDYHKGLRRKLRSLASFVRTLAPSTRARPLLDDAPILERAWAVRAGLGFIGKNGMLITPGLGSLTLLAEVLTTLELQADIPQVARCGRCTRCLDVCPTRALVAPFVLDARRCVAYLTIELRGPIPENLQYAVGDKLFGCDDCQTVCPFNASERGLEAERTEAFAPLPRWGELGLEDLVTPERCNSVMGATPVGRATPQGLARNARLVLEKRGALAKE